MTDVRDASAPAAAADRTTGPHGRFVWYELMTSDADAAGRFYSAVVPGWRFGERMPGDVDYRAIESDGGNAGGVLQIDDSMRTHGARPTWLGYIGVDDVDASLRSIEQAGGKTLMGAFDIPDAGRIAMVADPQGGPFYVMKPQPPAGRENAPNDAFSPDKQGRVSWNELNTSDPAAARRFYGSQFGWSSDDFMPMGEMGEYRFLDHQGARIGAISGLMPGQQTHWRYYHRVPSVGAAKRTVEELGGTVAVQPMQVPTGDYILIAIDPQGAEFALVGGQ